MSTFLLFIAVVLILVGLWVLAYALKHSTSTAQAEFERALAAQAKAALDKAEAAAKKVL